MRTAFLILLLLTIGCESLEDLQQQVEQEKNTTLPPSEDPFPTPPLTETPKPPPEEPEETLKPEIQEAIQEAKPSEPIAIENQTLNATLELPPPKSASGNICHNLPKLMCNEKPECEFTVDLGMGRQYCRQRCRTYPITECENAPNCVIKRDRRNNTLCLTNCAALTNAELCDMHGDCGWKEGNCTSLGYK